MNELRKQLEGLKESQERLMDHLRQCDRTKADAAARRDKDEESVVLAEEELLAAKERWIRSERDLKESEGKRHKAQQNVIRTIHRIRDIERELVLAEHVNEGGSVPLSEGAL